MVRLKVSQIGIPIKVIKIKSGKNFNKFISDLIKLGVKTHKFMIGFIKENTHTKKIISQSDAKPLIETIDFNHYTSAIGFGWSIGDVDKLNTQSRQWKLINYGGKHPQAGKTIPGFFESTDVFLYAPNSGAFITIGVNTIIEPMGYIEATRAYLDLNLIKVINRYNRG